MVLNMNSWPPEAVLSGVLISLVVLYWYFFRHSRTRRLMSKVPGPVGWPLIGNALDLYVDHELILLVIGNLCKQFKKGIFKLWLAHRPYIIIYDAKYAEPILSSPSMLNKSVDYKLLEPWLATGLLTSTGNKWRSRRKLLTSAFHFRILEDFVHVFNEQSQILVQQLSKEVGKDSFNIFPYITLCTLDIICVTAMGKNINAQGHEDSDYVQAIYRIGDIIHSRQLRPWLWPDWIFYLIPDGRAHEKHLKILQDFSKKVIQERKQDFFKNENVKPDGPSDLFETKRRLAFLDLLLSVSDNGRVLSDDDLREEVNTFMFEGHDTTAAGISWTLFLLGNDLAIQAKVHEELDLIFGDSDRQCTSEDAKEMKFLECVIKESLRLFPSVPIIGRSITQDIQLDEFLIPAGVTALLFPYFLHRNSAVFKDPEAFKPERFSQENVQGRHPYAYVPFSAGPRNCIGQKFALMEEKVVLSTILRKFQLKSLIAKEDMQVLAELILRPHGGMPMKITRRNEKH